MIGEMRNRVTFNRYSYTTDAGGGVSAVFDSAITLWAKIESRSGFSQIIEGRATWPYDYKMTLRFDKLNPINQNDIANFDGKKLKVQSLQILEEGKRFYQILRCSTVD